MFTFTIVSSIQWQLYHLRPIIILPVLYIFLWLITTKLLTTGHCYVSNLPPHHPIAILKRVWALWQVLSPWHEPNMVHVRLLSLQPGLCDVHSCSLLFVGALAELQHFISGAWSEMNGSKFRGKAPRVFISRPIILKFMLGSKCSPGGSSCCGNGPFVKEKPTMKIDKFVSI